ncbi:MFS-type transporter SLC18B1 [Orchesella cincta]|uniref:MFS-type transporter SLC18B1 n=1 Tax=Orchesella cincta TaxID=48709 RepID=A0A1D2MXX7_ORCCI|nr:MFS-type transporter SLC18B1 [Orchesella cincta]
MGFSAENMALGESDCCGESICVGTASQNPNVDKKCDRNTLTASKSSNCTCETDINENLGSSFSSKTSSIKGSKLDTATGLGFYFSIYLAALKCNIIIKARQKGATASEYGLVFGILPATVFIISPFFGAKMSSLGPIRVFIGGVFTTGFGCIIFGLLNQIEGRVPFILTSLFVRVVEAIGDAAFETASFTLIAAAFPQSIGTSMALLEVSYGIGHIVGPALGGTMYQIGGYSLPFAVIGSLLVSSSIATYFFFPGLKEINVKSETALESFEVPSQEVESSPPVVLGGFSIFRILKIPVIAIAAYSIIAAMTSVGVLSCNLEHHLEQFQLNKLQIGAVFILNGGVYAVTAPVWGWICDRTEDQKLITLAGAVFTILGFIFIGPIPYFPLDTTLPMSCIGLVLFGVGLAGILVPSFIQILKDAIANGYPDDISTYGLVSSVWTSMSAAGPVVVVLGDWVGFRWSTVFVIAGMVVLMILLAGYYAALCRLTATSQNLTRNKVDGQL